MSRMLTLTNRERAALANAELFAELDRDDVEALCATALVTSFNGHDMVFREGETAAYFYCILEGYVRLYRLGDGKEADIRICEPGDSFAECLLQMRETYPYNAQAIGHAVLARFRISKVRALIGERPAIGRAIMKSLSLHLLSMMECLASDRMQTAPQRVAHYLLTHCIEDGPAASLHLPIPKNLLARKLGLAPEALSRAFSTLKAAGVTVHGRTIAISDMEMLRQV